MKHKKSGKTKKIVAGAMASLCVLSSMSVIGINAATEKYTHTVAVAGAEGETAVAWINKAKKGDCSETFNNYPEIFNNTISRNKARADNGPDGAYKKYKDLILQRDSPSYPTVFYGTLKKGKWRLFYKYKSGGGFRDTATVYMK